MNQRNNIEFRIKDVNLDCEGEMKISGYINVTERQSETLYSKARRKWFKETMQKGVFERALQKNANNIPCLLEHNWECRLANTSEGTLHLREDNIGLRFDALINDPDVYEQVRNKQINSCSFGFRIIDQEIRNINQRLEETYVKEIELLEVSLVRNPAYVGSLVESRALESALAEDEETNEPNKFLVDNNTLETKDIEEDTKELEKELIEEQEEKLKENSIEETIEETTGNSTEEMVEETNETKEEERAVEEVVVTEDQDVKEDVKEVLDEVIESKEKEIEYLENVGQAIDEYKEDIKEEMQETVENLEGEKKACDYELLKLQLEVLRLKEMKLKL